MIAGIGDSLDISVFLSSDEIDRLKAGTLDGVMVYWSHPKQQKRLCVGVDTNKSGELVSSRLSVVASDGNYKIYLGENCYEELVRDRQFHCRYDTFGSKIELLDVASLQGFSDRDRFESLKFYKEHKGELRF
ncbi:MAG: hypothetical protein U9R08_01855 [Nanoarchaeota archaeon]|nr:hypothetical protein [Nanoarchaeota archaeon]